MDITATVEAVRKALAPYRDTIACAYLFGSQARGEARRDSDVDLAVLYRDEPPPTLDGLGLELIAAVEAATGRPADIVVLNRAAPDLVHRILRDGVLVLEGDRSARVRFEVRSRAEYFDVLPYLREYRRGTGVRHDRS
jgi:predicted nucleotidyltransferase